MSDESVIMQSLETKKLAIIGLGYVGLPLAVGEHVQVREQSLG